jgi:hypothetical protein
MNKIAALAIATFVFIAFSGLSTAQPASTSTTTTTIPGYEVPTSADLTGCSNPPWIKAKFELPDDDDENIP